MNLHSYQPKVSLLLKANYVTPDYDHFLQTGRLTDKRIEAYTLQGRYGTERQLAAKQQLESVVLRKNRTEEKKRQQKRDEKSLNKYIEGLLK